MKVVLVIFMLALATCTSLNSRSKSRPCNPNSSHVCAGDGKTYANECLAEEAGNDTYESGVCEEMQ